VPDERDDLAGLGREIDVMQDQPRRIVAEMHVTEFDPAAAWGRQVARIK